MDVPGIIGRVGNASELRGEVDPVGAGPIECGTERALEIVLNWWA